MKQFSNVTTAFAAAACLASVAEARRSPFFARNNAERNWQPAIETAAAVAIAAGQGHGDLSSMPQIAMNDFVDGVPAPEPPATTAAPALNPLFLKRDSSDNTCAYVSGISSISLYCDTTDECVANSHNSFVGCCPDTSTTCPIPTTCYPSSEGSLYTTSNGYTLWCGSSEYPECVTHYYADDVFTGYMLLGCGKTEAVDKVWYLPTSDSSSSSSTSSKSKKSTSTTSPSSAPATSTSPSTPTSPLPSTSPTGSTSKKSNAGAIAGGVVGGVAGLALIGLGVFFLLRRNNTNKVNNVGGAPGAPGAGAPGPNGGQPPMGQQPYYVAPGGGDPNTAGYAAAGAAAGGVAGLGAAAAYQQHQQQDPNLYNPNQQYGGYPPQQSPPIQQQDAKLYDPYNPNGQQYDPNAAAASASGSPPLVQSPQSGVYNTAAVAPAGGQISPHEAISPYSAPPPQPGMGFHSGPVPTTLDVAELSTERNDGELRELA
ncbi:hypothetical protein Sste5346_001177 [Sporothrix stenoceras]|uniref:Epidermal growth factor receptor-like transmembrane-juxtamembrane segment domain-containing protein n=1 Tax=Sporothrix stenoceras TaxID=5173 RepID=A0ABR3ZTE3_9PEZI